MFYRIRFLSLSRLTRSDLPREGSLASDWLTGGDFERLRRES